MPQRFSKRSKFNKTAAHRLRNIDMPVDNHRNTQLHKMVIKSSREEVRKLLKVGACPNRANKDGQTPLYAAIALKDKALINSLIEYGASFNIIDRNDRTPLMFAIENKCSVEFLDFLLSKGNFEELNNRAGHSLMHTAAANDNVEILELLKDKKFHLDHENKNGETPLHLAAQKNARKALRFLITNKANTHLRTNNIESLLHLAAQTKDDETLDILLSDPTITKNINRFKSYQTGSTPLMVAVEKGSLSMVRKMLDAGADVNMRNSINEHSLLIAVKHGYIEIAQLLIERGADVRSSKQPLIHEIDSKHYDAMLSILYRAGADLDAANSIRNTALHNAVSRFEQQKVKKLLELGADPNLENSYGKRPIDLAIDVLAYDGREGIIKLLLKHGANPNLAKAENSVYSPLHISIMHVIPAATDILLEAKGIKIDEPAKNHNAYTPLLLAASYRSIEQCRKFIARGADVQKKDGGGRTLLHIIAEKNESAFLKELLANKKLKPLINAKDSSGQTALHYATRSNVVGIIQILLDNGADPLVNDNIGYAPIHRAVLSGNKYNLDAFKKVDPKADIFNLRTTGTLNTPLHLAADDFKQSSVEMLLKLGSKVDAKNANGFTPLHIALNRQNLSVIHALVSHIKSRNINIDSLRDNNQSTPLHQAIKNNTPPYVIKKLLTAGSDINAKDKEGKTPLGLAKEIAINSGNDNLYFELSGERLKKPNTPQPPKPKNF